MTVAASRARFDDAVYRDRLRRAPVEAGERGLDALLVSPSVDYVYLLGYAPHLRERLTCLVLPVQGDPTLVVPQLEAPMAAHELGELADDLELIAWRDGEDAAQLVRSLLAPDVRRVGVQDQMPATFVLRLQAVLDPIELREAGHALSALRRRKGPEEIERLTAAGQAADAAMTAITGERLSGRTEAEVSARVRELLVAAGHDTAEFAIVASGPNAASPHHEAGERVIGPGDAVVLDIGGSIGGYQSDTTRTAFVGEPPPDFTDLYEVLHEAQETTVSAARPGITGRELDAVAATIIAEGGYGDRILHRTGHGIGMETHEEPYIFEGNDQPLQVGDAFSVEPGIYVAGEWGARIEDIVMLTDAGPERLNQTSRDLYLVE